MNVPGLPSIAFLVYLLGVLPWAAFKSARRVKAAQSGKSEKPLPSKTVIWVNTIFLLWIMFGLAWAVGRGFGFDVFALPELGARDIGLAFAALGLVLALRSLVRAFRSEEERRNLVVFKLAPRGGREWLLWGLMVVAAGIAEEAAYRGVAMQILWYSLGNPWIAAVISALAFAAAHWIQGFKSCVMIFGFALVMQGLVAITHTLVLAMIVHTLFDVIAGWLIRRQADVYLNQDASTSASA